MDFLIIWAAATEATATGITLSTVLNVIWCVFLVLIGVNMLIIVHEFGHFIVARMCGVRCDKFYIWFDIYGWKICKFKWGDTEYGLGVLPLGGYVKMFGQEDSPGAIKAEIERAKKAQSAERRAQSDDDENQSEASPHANDAEIAKLEQSLYAPDSYLAKSVPQRMAIIVAGVVMNVIFAFICGVGAFMFGMEKPACVIGGTAPGTSAWEVGLMPGDQILAIDGKPIRFHDEIVNAITGASKDTSELLVRRPNVDEPLTFTVMPKMQSKALYATIGIVRAESLQLGPQGDFFSPFAQKNDQVKQLRGKETLVAINGTPITSTEQRRAMEIELIDKPLTYTFERKEKSGETKTMDVTLQPEPIKTLGFRFAMGPITALRNEGKDFGFQLGDVIQSVNGQEFAPTQLPGWIQMQIYTGVTKFEIKLLRNENEVILNVPISSLSGETHFISETNISVPELGITYTVLPVVVAKDDVAAEKVPVGGTVEQVKFLTEIPKELKGKTSGKETKDGLLFVDETKDGSFPNRVETITQLFPVGTKVELTVKTGDESAEYVVPIVAMTDWFNDDRGWGFDTVKIFFQASTFGEAVKLGAVETQKALLMVYSFLKNLTYGNATGTSRISAKGMGGPIAIVGLAYHFASNGMGLYLWLLCLLGANLAVLNILPIPVLDGGHIVFLTYEAIFRKPPNETVQVILSYIGLLLLLSLMLWVFALDLGFISRF